MVCPFRFEGNDKDASKRTLIFSCDLCSLQEPNKGRITANSTCRRRFLKLLPFINTDVNARFQSERQTCFIPSSTLILLDEYVQNLNTLKHPLARLAKVQPELKTHLATDPLHAIELLEKLLDRSNSRHLQNLYAAIKRTRLFKKAKKIPRTSKTPNNVIYEILFEEKKIACPQCGTQDSQILGQICDSYSIGPFSIRIYELETNSFEKFYHVVANLEDSFSTQIIRFLAAQSNTQSDKKPELLKFDEVISRKNEEFQHYLSSSFDELNETERTNLATFATTQSLDLINTMPLLLDDKVQELYLDKPGESYYLDHADWGRCRSNLLPSTSELTRIVTRLRLESHRPLDERTPSLKTEIKSKLFHVRAAVDIPPLANDGLHLNIRKLRLKLLTLPELIDIGTLSINAAAFLILCMRLRLNITICGEPSTGKTTLANAINLTAPPFWRQIAIEDALESAAMDEWGRHKITFKVDPFDSLDENRHTKSNEIIRLLHRSPDWVFLGEIQTAEHSAAMFHAVSAGIRGIQTCHANSINELLLRWHIHHKIPEVCFRSLGLLVYMVREIFSGKINRRIAQISEVTFKSGKPELLTLYEWNKYTKQLESVHKSIITPSIIRACNYTQITEDDIREGFSKYKAALKDLIENRQFTPEVVIKTFDKAHSSLASRFSLKSNFQLEKVHSGGGTLGLPQSD